MQIFIILLVALVYLADSADPLLGRGSFDSLTPGWAAALGPWSQIALSIGIMTALAGLTWLTLSLCRRSLDRHGHWRALVRSERIVRLVPVIVIIVFACEVVFLNWVGAVRAVIGDLVLLDEAIAMAPPLAVIVALWGAQYPISRRVRESTLIRRFDEGAPVYPIWTRRQFIIAQLRLHVVLLLLPMMLIAAWGETIQRYWPAQWDWFSPGLAPQVALIIGAAGVFLFAPLMIRRIWDTTPLAPGPLRDRLSAVCSGHAIRVRNILIWNTYGGMINGAVMGLIGPLRYVLLTDALLDHLEDHHVEAVMAHEIGHIRRHHIPWLVVCLIAIVSIAGLIVSLALEPWDRPLPMSWLQHLLSEEPAPPAWIDPLAAGATLVSALIGFGWVSRRFERQADTFAVQHLSGLRDRRARSTAFPATAPALTTPVQSSPLVTESASQTMVDALRLVSDLNHASPRARSWRHGSIASRQRYLASLVGCRADRLSIDRQVILIKFVAAATLLAGATLAILNWNA